MSLVIICVYGPGSTGKSTTIREFVRKHLGYHKTSGDVLGIFQMPRTKISIGVSGSGDALHFILTGRKFLMRYEGLQTALIAARSEGDTIDAIRAFSKKKRARLIEIPTVKIIGAAEQMKAVTANVAKIKQELRR